VNAAAAGGDLLLEDNTPNGWTLKLGMVFGQHE
jgi:hypothetical protein